jgi:hypothetical protein
MQPDFINEPGQIDPARHHFARTARVNNFFHKRIIAQDEPAVNCANGSGLVPRSRAIAAAAIPISKPCNLKGIFEFLKKPAQKKQ